MDVFPKFIIETDDILGDCLIMSKCTYHREIVTCKDKVKGGGWFKYDEAKKTFTFSGDSTDFGRAKIEDIQNCINLGNVFTNNLLAYSIVERFNFNYWDYCEMIELINKHKK